MGFTQRVVVEVDWIPENKGMEVVGRLLKIETIQYKDGPGLVYVIASKKTKGEVIRFRGATRLNQLINRSDIGKVICVRYNGENKSKEVALGMNYPKDFTVAVDEGSADPKVTDPDVTF